MGLALRRLLDPSSLRRQRVRIAAMIRTESAAAAGTEALVALRYSTSTSTSHDQAATKAVASKTWTRVEVVADVDPDAGQLELALVLRKPGTAWFKDVSVTLPGMFSVRITGSRVRFPDGSLVQGHGILPDIVVHPTVEAARAGRDEILEEALRRARAGTAAP